MCNDAGHIPKEQYLYRLIEKTRYARINSEKRLLELDLFVRHVSIYYACLTTILTILSIYATELKVLPFLSVSSAILLTIWTAYASSQNYALQAREMRLCYTDLQKLLFDMDAKQDDPSWCDPDKAGERYSEILKRTENHTEADYSPMCPTSIFGRPVSYYLKRIAAYCLPPLVCLIVLFGVNFNAIC